MLYIIGSNWLLESPEVESAYSLRGCSTQKSSRMIRCQRRDKDFAVFFIVFGLVAGKYALICAMDIQKIQMVLHIFSGFA